MRRTDPLSHFFSYLLFIVDSVKNTAPELLLICCLRKPDAIRRMLATYENLRRPGEDVVAAVKRPREDATPPADASPPKKAKVPSSFLFILVWSWRRRRWGERGTAGSREMDGWMV